jgi:hypothetical protein
MIYLALGMFMLGCLLIGLLVLLVYYLGAEGMLMFIGAMLVTGIIVGASLLIDRGIKEIENASQVELMKGE